MTEPTLNGTEAARVALEESWRRLAPLIDQASIYDAEAKHDPTRLEDPSVLAWVRWLNIFERELGAVQSVYDALEGGAKLNADEIRTARATSDKLLDVIQKAQERVLQPA